MMLVSRFACFVVVTCSLLVGPAWAGTVDYEYDRLGRLTRAVYDTGTQIRYLYDDNGNLLQRIVEAVPIPDAGSLDSAGEADTGGGGDSGPDDAASVTDTASGPDGAAGVDASAPVDAGRPDSTAVTPVDAGPVGDDPGDDGCGCAASRPTNSGVDLDRSLGLGLLMLVGLLWLRRRSGTADRRLGDGSPPRLLAYLAVVVTGLVPQVSSARTVCPDGPPTCDNRDIHWAINDASDGETITVEPGYYQESNVGDFSCGSKKLTLKSRQSDPRNTTIDAEGNGTVLFLNCLSVVDGFTIRGGHSTTGGGGLFAAGGVHTVRNCIIENNISDRSGGGYNTATGSTTLILVNTVVRNNQALNGSGGGIGSMAGTVHLKAGSRVENNSARNSSGTCSGGGIYARGGLLIEDSTVTGNTVRGPGPTGAGIATGSSVWSGTIRNSTISNNVATATSGTAFGAGLDIDTGAWVIEGGSFFGNRAEGESSKGGAIHIGTRRWDTNPVRLRGVSISGNDAAQGGGVYCGAPERLFEASDQVSGNTVDDYFNCSLCDAEADPAEEQGCSTGDPGACGAGHQTCIAPGVWGECAPDTLPGERREICDNEEDDDCDGKVDEEDEHCLPATRTTNADHPACGNSNEPVNTFTGELYDSYAPDINLGGPLPLYFARYYSSGMAAAGVTGRLGDNWRHTFEWSMEVDGTTAHIIDNRGHTFTFSKVDSDWILQGVGHTPYQLLEADGDFLLGDPRSNLVFTFDAAGQLAAIEDGKGNVLTLTHSAGDLIEVADTLGRALTFAYGANARISEVSDGTRTAVFGYTGDDLTSVTDLMEQTTRYSYAAGGLLTSWTLPEGNSPYSQTFDGEGRVATQTDADDNTHHFAYDEASNLTTMTDPAGDTREHVHTNLGELVTLTGKDGVSYDMGYDGGSRRNGITDRLGDTTHYSYHPDSGKLASIRNPDGSTTQYSFVDRSVRGITFHDVSRIIYADGSSDSYAYDTLGNLVSHLDRGGHQRRYTYNPNGQVLSITNAAEGVTRMTYNADGTLASRIDAADNTTRYSYDALRRLVQIDHADTTTRRFSYDDADRLESVTDGLGNEASYAYDNNGNLVGTTDRARQTKVLVYDEMDRLVEAIDPAGRSTSRTYDDMERLATTTDRSDNTTTYTYDNRDRLTSITDANRQVWSRTYDLENIITSASDPLSNTMEYVSDNLGRVIQTTSPLTHSSDVSYDDLGRVNSAANALGEVTSFSYDARGLVVGVDVEGVSASYSHNAFGQLIATTDPNGRDWVRSYDDVGRMTGRTDPLGNSSGYSYDSMNRLSQVTLPGGLGTIDFSCDGNGNAVERSYSDGLTLSATYDDEDRLTAADGMALAYDENSAIVESNGIAMTRDASRRIETVTFGAGKELTYRYDARGQLSEVEDWLGGVSTFSYDVAGRLTAMTRPNDVTATYTWDDDSRLVGIEEGSLSSIALTRDAVGQITRADRSMPQTGDPNLAAAVTQSFDAASQVATSTYDPLGRLLDDGARTYVWDLASRLVSYTEDGNTVSFTYDGAGMRTSRTEGGVTRDFVWNHALGLSSVAIEREGAADLRYFIHTPNGELLYSVEADGNRRFYHFDEMGNTTFLSDEAGATIASYDYSPYGEVIGNSGAIDNAFTWQGQHGVSQDSSGGLYYMRARYYDAGSARFISRDPISSSELMAENRYQYAAANPLGSSDPTGLSAFDWLSDALGGLDNSYADQRHKQRIEAKYKAINKKYEGHKPGSWDGRPNSPTAFPAARSGSEPDTPIYTAVKASKEIEEKGWAAGKTRTLWDSESIFPATLSYDLFVGEEAELHNADWAARQAREACKGVPAGTAAEGMCRNILWHYDQNYFGIGNQIWGRREYARRLAAGEIDHPPRPPYVPNKRKIDIEEETAVESVVPELTGIVVLA